MKTKQPYNSLQYHSDREIRYGKYRDENMTTKDRNVRYVVDS